MKKRMNASPQRKALRAKYRERHGDEWWKDESVKAQFDKELGKTSRSTTKKTQKRRVPAVRKHEDRFKPLSVEEAAVEAAVRLAYIGIVNEDTDITDDLDAGVSNLARGGFNREPMKKEPTLKQIGNALKKWLDRNVPGLEVKSPKFKAFMRNLKDELGTKKFSELKKLIEHLAPDDTFEDRILELIEDLDWPSANDLYKKVKQNYKKYGHLSE
jgi:hypothetical protein